MYVFSISYFFLYMHPLYFQVMLIKYEKNIFLPYVNTFVNRFMSDFQFLILSRM